MTEEKHLLTFAIVGLVLAGLLITFGPGSVDHSMKTGSMMENKMEASGYVHDGTIVTEKTFEFVTDSNFEYEVTRYPSGATITSPASVGEKLTIGIVVDPDNLKFGSIPAGENSGKRIIELSNLKDTEAEVEFIAAGDIVPFVEFSQNNFVLSPNSDATVDVIFKADETEEKEYVGEIDVIIKRQIQ